MLKKLSSILLVIAMIASIAACGKQESNGGSAQGPTLAKIKKEGKLVLGTSADYPPYEWISKDQDGQTQIIGADIALAQAIADELGVELVVQDMQFNAIIPSLKSGEVDIGLAGIVDNEERREVVDFSESYFAGDQGLLVRKADAAKYTSKDSLKGAKLAAQIGSTQDELAKTIEGADYEGMTNQNNIVLELKNHTIDAMVVAGPPGRQFASLNQDLVYQDVGFEDEGKMSVAVAKGNEDLIEIINKVIGDWTKEGKMDEEIAKYTDLSSKEVEELQ
ncbi:ABC transporter, substrate-binding protein, family 3 [Peptoniphilus sp. oral taxon 375 str. F0436]|nr:ABC transporter, substrate-binding protein, family 3 [Peptoniphilus sp. oral taxon 375 str. F0436]